MSVTARVEAQRADSSKLLGRQRRCLLLCAAFWPLWLALRLLAPSHADYVTEAVPLLPLVAFACLWLTAVAGGSRLLDALRLTGIGQGQRVFFSSLLGFAALSFFVFLVAAVHLLYDWVLCLCFGAAAASLAVTLPAHRPCSLGWRGWWQRAENGDAGQKCAIALLAIPIVLGTAGAIAPATDSDTLLYHLGAPSIYVQHHGFVYVPHNLWTNIPLFTEMMYAAGLCVMNQTLARLFVPCSYVLVLIGSWCFCRRHLPHVSPWVPALLVGSIPLLAILNCTSLNDVTLLAYELGALYAFVSFWRAGTREERRGWLIVASVVCACAASIKYAGWLPAAVLLPATVWRMGALEGRRGTVAACSIVLTSLLLPGLWLAKNVGYTGNPVYPLAFSVFGGRNWSAALAAEYQAHMMSFGVHDEGLLGAVTAPVRLVLDEGRFGSKLGIGPLFLLLSPLAVWSCRRMSRLGRFLCVYALVHYGAWTVGPQVMRYVMPGLVVWSFVLAEGVAQLPGPPRRPARKRFRPVGARALVHGIICAGAAFNIAWFGLTQQSIFHSFDAIYGVANRRAYLQRSIPYYSTVTYANTALPSARKLLFVGEWRTFYARIPFAADTGPDVTIICEYVNRSRNVDELLAALRRDGFTHLLYNPEGEALLQRTFGYLRFASDDKERIYRQIPTHLKLVHAEHGVLLYELEPSGQPAAVADSGAA